MLPRGAFNLLIFAGSTGTPSGKQPLGKGAVTQGFEPSESHLLFGGQRPPTSANTRFAGDYLISVWLDDSAKPRGSSATSYQRFGMQKPGRGTGPDGGSATGSRS
jgi:hypothetical protein